MPSDSAEVVLNSSREKLARRGEDADGGASSRPKLARGGEDDGGARSGVNDLRRCELDSESLERESDESSSASCDVGGAGLISALIKGSELREGRSAMGSE